MEEEQKSTTEEIISKIVLIKPYFSSDGDSCSDYRPPNLIQRILSLFQNVRIGSDFATMQLPAQFNVPKSHLQFYGEPVYGVGSGMLGKCNSGESSMERLVAVIAWSVSTLHPMKFGTAPYNPILGETHHVSRGSLNVLVEQISHHPPVAALHATDEKENLELLWCQNPTAKFYGTSVEVELRGKRHLKLLNHNETYVLNTPKLLVKFLPVPGLEWIGKQRIQCSETGLEAELIYGGTSFLGLRGSHRSIKGKIIDSSSLKPLSMIDGTWDRTITRNDLVSGHSRVIYNAKEAISGLKTPIIKDPNGIWPSESAGVWSEVSQGILNNDWVKATEAKKAIEEKQRNLLRDRKSRGETWTPKHFSVSYSKENGWDCSPIKKIVPPAPIVVPIDS